MDIALVQDLSDLASRLRREYTVEGLKEITATLEKVSQRLEATRESPVFYPDTQRRSESG